MKTSARPAPFIHQPTLEISEWFLGHRMSYLAGNDETGGMICLMDALQRDRCLPPPHVHEREDEWFYVLDGIVDFRAGGTEARLGPGGMAFLPRGVPHAYSFAGDTARLLIGVQPGHFEVFFRRFGRPAGHLGLPPAPCDAPDTTAMNRFGAGLGMHVLPDGSDMAAWPAADGAPRPVFAERDSRQPINVLGTRMRVLLDGADTGGRFALVESVEEPGNGPPLHIHHAEEELFHVVEGDFLFRVGDRTIEAGPETTVFAPRDIPHTYACVGPGIGRMLTLVQPPSFIGFFRAIDAMSRQGPPDVERLVALGGDYHLEFTGPPLRAG